ncbi:UDP-N-acetylmuramoyl-L-alanyl-D-glutamate--2,6-diaminopimelate ligase [Clostridium sediminicola]|uniref:UDP-N-acetylmuramoyl-L-alanyl-D-glutamate--2, 6-diaminopimelate ligase n=1 Tax=Clostridium sediminicola TaxID=3114879 RepID=UPI0031F1CCAD
MILKEVLSDIEYKITNGSTEIEVNKIEYDSRKVEKGDIFICIKGFKVDGHDYIQNAIEKGASVIIAAKSSKVDEHITFITVEDTRKTLALVSANFYGNPSKKLKVIGITGTNGKTTSTFMIKAILEKAGYKTGLVGTIANYIGTTKIKSERTTPESLELQKLFRKMIDENVDYCIMEVSSHSLSLDRVYGVDFDYGIFTNLTRDHLDFHHDFESYYNAKLQLFKSAKHAIINIDDSYGEKIIEDINSRYTTYSINANSDYVAKDVNSHSKGVDFKLETNGVTSNINLNIPGLYNVYNALGSIVTCLVEGVSKEDIISGLKDVTVPGRCELVAKEHNLNFEIIIDYAHTPDGLENILRTAKEFTKGRLIGVFGCGGDRDNEKRPIMGKIGSEISDIAIVTSDNPRTEPPMEIINQILKGIAKEEDVIVIEHRRDAIKKAISIARENDVIVIAGKGHEDYQVLKDKTIHFDEREIVDEILKEEN